MITIEFHWFWPKRLDDLLDNKVTFGVISTELDIGILILGFGFWIRGA